MVVAVDFLFSTDHDAALTQYIHPRYPMKIKTLCILIRYGNTCTISRPISTILHGLVRCIVNYLHQCIYGFNIKLEVGSGPVKQNTIHNW